MTNKTACISLHTDVHVRDVHGELLHAAELRVSARAHRAPVHRGQHREDPHGARVPEHRLRLHHDLRHVHPPADSRHDPRLHRQDVGRLHVH